MPSGSTRLTVPFLYSFPLIVLKSSASAIDADNPVKITSVACQCFTAADSASFALHTATTKNNVLSAVNRRFEFQKRSQLFIRTHNKTLSVGAVRVNNEDRSPVAIHDCNAFLKLQSALLRFSALNREL